MAHPRLIIFAAYPSFLKACDCTLNAFLMVCLATHYAAIVHGGARREVLGVAYRLAELRARTDDELIRAHDEVAHEYGDTPFEIRAELARRDAHRRGERIENLTWVITRMTVMITALTAVNVGLVAFSIIGA